MSCISLEWELTTMHAAQSWFASLGEQGCSNAPGGTCGVLIWLARADSIRFKMGSIWLQLPVVMDITVSHR